MHEIPTEEFDFDAEKFTEVVHFVVDYVASELGADAVGNVKLHKCLYYADMFHFLDNMRPLTGVDYQRQKFGPTARHLTRTLKDLEARGRVHTETVNFFGFPKKRYTSCRKPETNRLSQPEKDLISQVAKFVCEKTAVEISEFSHDDVWASVPMGSRIPYCAAFAMFRPELSPEDLDEARIEAQQLVSHIEERRRADRVV